MPLEGLQVKATPEQDIIVNNTCVPAKYTPPKSQRVTQQSQTNTIKKRPKAAFPCHGNLHQFQNAPGSRR